MSIICDCGCKNPDDTQYCSVCGRTLNVRSVQQPVYSTVNNIQIQGEKPISVLGWIGYFILFGIPVVNIVTYIVILCCSPNKTLKNMVIAQIVMIGIICLISTVIIVIPSLIHYLECMP